MSGGDGIKKFARERANFFMEAGGAAAVTVSHNGKNVTVTGKST